MFDPNQFKDLVIKPTLKDLASVLPGADHPSAVNLLLGTCWQESRGGTYLKQLGGGPALGVMQVEPATHEDLWDNYIEYRPDLHDYLSARMTHTSAARALVTDLAYATIIARLVYYRQSFEWPEPDDIRGLAAIYKRWFNTAHGAATESEFVRNFPREVV